jgi:hypothetical protein
MLRGMMTGALLAEDHAMSSLGTAERRKVVTERGGLDAIMTCIADAMSGDDDMFLVDAFECLAELGGAEACRADMVDKGGVSLVLALTGQHVANPSMAELGCHLMMLLLWKRAEAQEAVAGLPYDSGLAVVLDAMRHHQGNAGVQCCACGALAGALENESNCTLAVAQGGLQLVCSAMRSFPFPGDVLLQWHAVAVLARLCAASPADYTVLAVRPTAPASRMQSRPHGPIRPPIMWLARPSVLCRDAPYPPAPHA